MILVLFNLQINGHPDHNGAGNFFGSYIYKDNKGGGDTNEVIEILVKELTLQNMTL